MNANQISIRACSSLEDFEACVELQRRVWKFSELETAPSHIFMIAARTGGLVLVADDGNQAVGFASGFAAIHGDRIFLHSDMVAVLPEYQSRGIGRMLKLRQREEMLHRGIELIEWTFDPLALKNALFNITRLGAVIRRFIPNAYGFTSSPLHANLPTDRLVAEWWLKSERVQRILSGESLKPAPSAVPISVPINIADLRRHNVAEAERIQAEMRRGFLTSFEKKYAVTGFDLNESSGTYLLEPDTN